MRKEGRKGKRDEDRGTKVQGWGARSRCPALHRSVPDAPGSLRRSPRSCRSLSRFHRDAFVLACLVAIGLLINPVLAAEPLEKSTRKGPVEAMVSLEPADPSIGDTVGLTVRVVGEKGVELLMPEFGQALERFAILDYTSDEAIDGEGRTVATQSYLLQPPRSGRQSIPPIMIEFVDRRHGATAAPQGLDAYELLTERLEFEVKSVLPQDASAELSPPLGKLPARERPGRAAWPWIVVAAIVLATAAMGWRLCWAARSRARRRTAYDVAIRRLGRLLAQPRDEPGQVDAFFVELSSIVRWYLENRFDLRAPELTTEEFIESMSGSPDLMRGYQPLLRDFLNRADLVKFANFVPAPGDVDESVAAARRFLEETRSEMLLADFHAAPSAAEVARA